MSSGDGRGPIGYGRNESDGRSWPSLGYISAREGISSTDRVKVGSLFVNCSRMSSSTGSSVSLVARTLRQDVSFNNLAVASAVLRGEIGYGCEEEKHGANVNLQNND